MFIPSEWTCGFLSLGRKGVVSGPVKLKSNSTGVFAVSVRRFPRWLMGGKGSRRLEENGGNQGTACVVVRVVLEKTSQA